MNQEKKLRYRISVRSESNHFIEATSADEAVRSWQDEVFIKHLPYKILGQEWIKGGFRLSVEIQTHLSQDDRDTLGEYITIDNVLKSGETIQ